MEAAPRVPALATVGGDVARARRPCEGRDRALKGEEWEARRRAAPPQRVRKDIAGENGGSTGEGCDKIGVGGGNDGRAKEMAIGDRWCGQCGSSIAVAPIATEVLTFPP